MTGDPTPHLERFASHKHACREFRRLVPETFNIANAILARHLDAVTRVALVEAKLGGLNTYTYGGLDYLSSKLSNVLTDLGVERDDSVALILPQSAAAIIAQLAVLKLGAIAVPIDINLDAAGLEFALSDSAPRVVIPHHTLRDRLRIVGAPIETVLTVYPPPPKFQDISPDYDFWRGVFEASAEFKTVDTPADAPAFVFYERSEGELRRWKHSHASLIYELPAFEMSQNFKTKEDSTLWTPQDWTTVDSCLGSVYPALWYGWRVAASETHPQGGDALGLIERCEITNTFMTLSGVDALRQSNQLPETESGLTLRHIVCNSPVPNHVQEWARHSLAGSINTIFSDTTFGSVAATCKRWYETPPGSPGRVTPGYSIETVDDRSAILPPRGIGRFAIRRELLEAPVGLASCQPGDLADARDGWVVTHKVGFKDEDGNVWLSSSE
ncbi:MAG TPA: AMP-binding protein [Blastocatellia bacterium]|nr:AMP-binding protein [Blastocatellia bacterium]